MNKTDLLSQIRYSERLCHRTARFYRHVQTFGTFMAVVGGSAALSALATGVPAWVSIAGAAGFSVFGAALIAIRPADKAASNEVDARRYAKLRTDAAEMTAEELGKALNKARESDAPELEALRDVAYNDVALEVGRPDAVVPLNRHQRIIAALA